MVLLCQLIQVVIVLLCQLIQVVMALLSVS